MRRAGLPFALGEVQVSELSRRHASDGVGLKDAPFAFTLYYLTVSPEPNL